jgi:hypothetical protein
MDTQAEICTRYESELAAIAALDRAYYLNGAATRADYSMRKDQLERVRARFCAELTTLRRGEAPQVLQGTRSS